MAEFINIINGNNITVIDDKFNIPKLIYRKVLPTKTPRSTVVPYVRILRPQWKYNSVETIREFSTLRELGFDFDNPTSETDRTKLVSRINSNLISFGRCSDGYAFEVAFSIYFDTTASLYILRAFTYSDVQNANVEICAYASNINLVPPSFGIYCYNENGEYIFDAMRGCLQNIGILQGAINVGSAIAATYNIAVPSGLNADNVFISYRSTLPYYGAYTIGSSGVGYAETSYAPKMTISDTNIKVELQKQSNTGSNSAWAIGHYFENVIYVPQPQGNFL